MHSGAVSWARGSFAPRAVREGAAVDAVHAGRPFAWPGRFVGALSGNVRNGVIGVEARIEQGIVGVEVAEVGELLGRLG